MPTITRSNEPGFATRVEHLEYATNVDGSAGLGKDSTGKLEVVNHATSSGKYGKGNAANYGHVKLVDDVGDGSGGGAGMGAADGVAASGSALQKLKESVLQKLQETIKSVENMIGGPGSVVVTDAKLKEEVKKLEDKINNLSSTITNNVLGKIPSPATALPKPLGTAAVGTSTKYAREDHVHQKPTGPTISSVAPTSSQGANGDIWYQYI